MPRRPRADQPGSWHHVINRAISRRTMLERRADFRYFLAQLARAVRRGEIEVHAFCLMGTHYHLLVRSPAGKLGKAMQRVQLAYSRWFNRSRRRDGSLVRGRYMSKPVDSLIYRRVLVRYIDSNPVKAGIVDSAAEYPYGSSTHYARPFGPPWLERSWVEDVVRATSGEAKYEPTAYPRVFGSLADELTQVVEQRFAQRSGQEFLDDLVGASSDHVWSWMVRKARLADGTSPGLPVVSLGCVDRAVNENDEPEWRIRRGQLDREARSVVRAGLGRSLCGASLTQLATHLGVSHSTASKLCRVHELEMQAGEAYSERAARIAHQALRSWRDA